MNCNKVEGRDIFFRVICTVYKLEWKVNVGFFAVFIDFEVNWWFLIRFVSVDYFLVVESKFED